MYVDTHCHIHEPEYSLPVEEVLLKAQQAGVNRMVVVGTSLESSQQAIEFAEQHEGVVASIGVHPHDTKDGYAIAGLADSSKKIAAVGEIGLDYYYGHSPKAVQREALRAQLAVAVKHGLPVIFHVRDAFDDFWPIFDEFSGVRGVLHSFTDTQKHMQKALERGLYIGVNGISTFTKDTAQQAMFDAIPLDRLLLETDAPFLTPNPYRGTINEPALVPVIAQYHANRRGVAVQEIADATTANARALFAHLK
jgi:TatD DNase family protein